MDGKTFGEMYLEAERELRDECDRMIANGELTVDEAEFRFLMVRDEILETMGDMYYGRESL